ncbi:unnamed protein product [Rotaria sordida]|uniref:Uncharacterized protein n=1 Tax=Rotaria sordida TaxID=392033 RepID=A0A818YC09_9BILA|nr:unnamed protein product [Rotaria sordida]
MQTTSSLEINDLLHKTDLLLLNNSKTREFNEIKMNTLKRRQTCPKINDTNNNNPIKNEIVKRPTSASSISGNSCCATTTNQRTRSNSFSASISSCQQIHTTSRSSLKTKLNKQINNSNSIKPSVPPISTQNDFEKLEQYDEKHPSMISIASYVDKVIFVKDHQSSKTADIFVNRLIRYHEEENDNKHEEIYDLSASPNRIRQRKIIPFKSKVYARIEQLTVAKTITSDNDDDNDEDHKWNDVGVDKVIPVVADEYNSDSVQYQQKKGSARSSDFGDDHSWADRVTAPPLNSLMLNTFPGLRHRVPASAVAPAPSPPPPPLPITESNQDYSRLVHEKAKQLEKQIELFEKENVLTLQEDLKQRETRWSTTISRLNGCIETLEYENVELKQEKEIIERKQLDLMHQLQTVSEQQLQEDTSSLSITRKSLVELQQIKPRPKNTGSITSKTQSLPKTMVIRNSESSIKPKITSNGRRTPTIVVGVNGIKNNVDTSRKFSSLSRTKRPTSMNELIGRIESIPIPTIIEQPIVVSERADSRNGGSDKDIHRFDRRNDQHLSS